MKAFSTEIQAELVKETIQPFVTVELDLTAKYYYTNLDRPIYSGGNKYAPATINVSDVSYTSANSVDYITFSMGNAGLQMSAILLGEEVRGKTVIVNLGLINSTTHATIGLEEIFRGFIDDWTIKEDSVEIRVANEFILWRKKPLRNCSVTCPWVFKGTQCAYAGGETWCDKTWDRCHALSNTDNFGGFRYSAAMVEKQIWWGREYGKPIPR